MSKNTQPVFSIVVRRFHPDLLKEIKVSLGRLQAAAKLQPGFLGEQNSYSHGGDYSEVVTVFAFDSEASRELWEQSDIRNTLVGELDLVPQESSKHTQFDGFAPLLQPDSQARKWEIVLILIFWILVVGAVLDFIAALILPNTFPPMWKYVGLISLNVIVISYWLLPWSNGLLMAFKRRFSKGLRKG